MSMPDVMRRRELPQNHPSHPPAVQGDSSHANTEGADISIGTDPTSPVSTGMQQARRLSTGVLCTTEYETAANPEERQRKGQCPSCGQQLYSLGSKRRWLFGLGTTSNTTTRNGKNKNTRKKPLTVPGLVNRGQCLKCSIAGNTEQPRPVNNESMNTPRDVIGDSGGNQNNHHHHHPNCDSNSCTVETQTSSSQGSAAPMTAFYEGSHNTLGERHGTGVMRWRNGDVYEGEFFRGSRQGTGTLNFADGSEYVGDWWNNYMHGQGTRRFVNGDIYVGEYRYSRCEGTGRFYFSNGDLYYGNWRDDKMEGFGRYYYHSGQRFEGYFHAGQRNGKGKLQRTDGSLDLYRYEDDKRVGTGVRWSTDRTKAWRLDVVRGTVRTKKISVAEAVSLVYQIDSGSNQDGGTCEDATGEFAQMVALEDTVDGPLPGQAA
jgi:hypothetical protein